MVFPFYRSIPQHNNETPMIDWTWIITTATAATMVVLTAPALLSGVRGTGHLQRPR